MAGEDFEVVDLIHATPSELLKGHFRVEKRTPGLLALVGWALGERSRATRIEVRCGEELIAESELTVKRPDIAQAFDRPDAATCGFEIVVEAQGDGESRLRLETQLEEGGPTPLGEVLVRASQSRWRTLFRRG
jgi:hypothetical protein